MSDSERPGEAAPPATRGQGERAYTQLREMIINNELTSGAMYLELELAQMLNMSRTPVREAAIRLAGDGLVEIRPRRGVRIRPLSSEDMEEVYAILTELESFAAAQVAEADLDAEDLQTLHDHVAEMERALAADDRQAWATADDHFHAALVRLAGNRRLESVVNMFSAQVARARLMTLWLRPSPTDSNADHRALVETIAAGDPRRAAEIHRAHRIRVRQLIIGLLRKHRLHDI